MPGALISSSNVETIHYVKCICNSSANKNMENYTNQPSYLNDMFYDFQKNHRLDNIDIFRIPLKHWSKY